MTYFVKDDLDLFVGAVKVFEHFFSFGFDDSGIILDFQTVLVTPFDGYVTVTWKFEPSKLEQLNDSNVSRM